MPARGERGGAPLRRKPRAAAVARLVGESNAAIEGAAAAQGPPVAAAGGPEAAQDNTRLLYRFLDTTFNFSFGVRGMTM